MGTKYAIKARLATRLSCPSCAGPGAARVAYARPWLDRVIYIDSARCRLFVRSPPPVAFGSALGRSVRGRALAVCVVSLRSESSGHRPPERSGLSVSPLPSGASVRPRERSAEVAWSRDSIHTIFYSI
jgi:hypothetical protein